MPDKRYRELHSYPIRNYSRHAINRAKQHDLCRRHSDAKKVKKYIRKGIKNRLLAVERDYKTGAMLYKTEEFTAVVRRSTVVTIYPNDNEKSA